MKFNEAVTKFHSWQSFARRTSTRSGYRTSLVQFGMYMRNCDIELITLDDVLGYLKGLQEFDFDHNSFLVKTIAFRKFFEFFGKQGVTKLDFELIPIMEREYRFPKVANIEDFNKMLKSIPKNNDPRHIRNRCMLLLFKDSGMRLGELLSLDWEMMDLAEMAAAIKTEKTKKAHPIRNVFWTPETNEALKEWKTKYDQLKKTMLSVEGDAVFISCAGVKTGRRLTGSGATEIARRLSHEAELGYVLNFHSLRHLFGRDMAEAGLDDTGVAIMMGHASPVSSMPYRVLAGDKMKEQYRKIKSLN